MADPLVKPLKWSKNYQIYADKHHIYDVFQELLKQIIITKPKDPLVYVRDRLPALSKGIYGPRVFVVGTNGNNSVPKSFAQRIAQTVGVKFLTLEDIIKTADVKGKSKLEVFLSGEDQGDEQSRFLLASIINHRVSAPDCEIGGYILYGFPQSKAQALCAQQMGLLPRQVFIFLPETEEEEEEYYETVEEAMKHVKTEEMRLQLKKDMAICLDIGSAYSSEICKLISYYKTKDGYQSEALESDLLETLLTLKPSSGPFIPRILVLGGPCSGKSTVASFLCKKFKIVNVNWVELVRGAARWTDDIAIEANEYLTKLTPMSNESVKLILTKRLLKQDCEKKGWVLRGFPESTAHCDMLKELFLEPNRVFILSCDQDTALDRLTKKKNEVLQRNLKGVRPGRIDEKKDYLIFPFSQASVAKRLEKFTQCLADIIPFYGNQIIFVDASMKSAEMKYFMETSIVRPPNPHLNPQ